MVKPHDDFRRVELLESMLYAIGDVGRETALRLHTHIGRDGRRLRTLQDVAAFLAVAVAVGVVIHHVKTYETTVQTLVAHEDGKVDKRVGILVVLQGQEYLLVVRLRLLLRGIELLLQQYRLRRVLYHYRTDYTREENHHHHAVEHIGIKDIRPVGHHHVHAYHRHGYSACRMGLGQAKHHVTRQPRSLEHKTRHISGKGLAYRGYHNHAEDDPQRVIAVKQHAEVDQHSHSYQEIRNEQRIADKLDTVHQRRHTRDIPV